MAKSSKKAFGRKLPMKAQLIFAVAVILLAFLIVFVMSDKDDTDSTVQADESPGEAVSEEAGDADKTDEQPVYEKPDSFDEITEVPEDDGGWGGYEPDVLTAEISGSVSITLTVTTDGSCMYLSPSVTDTDAAAGTQYAFFMYADGGTLLFSDTEGEPADAEKNAGKTNYFVTDRCFDQLVPAEYVDAVDYGAKWYVDFPKSTETHIYLRAYRLSDGILMGVTKATILPTDVSGNGYSYSITSFENNDVRSLGSMTDDECEALLLAAIDYMSNSTDDYFVFFQMRADILTDQMDEAVIEEVPGPYYGTWYDYTHTARHNKRMLGTMFAVNLRYASLGHVTVYYIPESQLFTTIPAYGEPVTHLSLVPAGYDAPFNFTVAEYNEYTAMTPYGDEFQIKQ